MEEVGAAIPGQRIGLCNGRLQPQTAEAPNPATMRGPVTLPEGTKCDRNFEDWPPEEVL